MMAALVIAAIGLKIFGPYAPLIINIAALVSPVGLMIWSIIFLKVEPNLTRIALLFVLLAFAGYCAFAASVAIE